MKRTRRALFLTLATLLVGPLAVAAPAGTVENVAPQIVSLTHSGGAVLSSGALVTFRLSVEDRNGENDLRVVRLVAIQGSQFVFSHVFNPDDVARRAKPDASNQGWKVWNAIPDDGRMDLEFAFNVPAAPTTYRFVAEVADETPLIRGTPTVEFTVAGPQRLRFLQTASSATSESPFQASVEILDELGNRATGASHPVTIFKQTGPSLGSVSGTRTVAADAGLATFSNVRLDRAGSYTLLAAAVGLQPDVSPSIAIHPGAATKTGFSAAPRDVSAGVPFVVVAEIQDNAGNLVATATGLLRLALAVAPPGAGLTASEVQTVGGVARFEGVTLSHAGAHRLRVQSNGLADGLGDPINVQPVASGLRLDLPAAQAQSLAPFQATATILDGQGNRVPGATHTVTLEVVDGPAGALLQGTVTKPAIDGVAQLSGLTLDRAGSYTLRATWDGAPSASKTIQIVAGPAAKLQFSGVPASTVSGTPFGLQVRFLDATGNPVTGAAPTVSLTKALGSSAGAFGGPATALASQGLALFDGLTLTGAGTYRLVASAPGFLSVASPAIVVNPTDLERVRRIEVSPSVLDVTAGTVRNLAVTSYDAPTGGNVIPGLAATFTLNPSNTDVGTVTSQGKFTAMRSGTAQLVVTLGSATRTLDVTVRPGPLAKIVLTPETASVNETIHANFLAFGADANGNRVPLGLIGWSIDNGAPTSLFEGELFTFPQGTSPGTHVVRAAALGLSQSAFVHVTTAIAPAEQSTKLVAAATTGQDLGVATSAYSVGIGSASQNATLGLVPPTGDTGSLKSADVLIARPAQNLAVQVETQLGGLDVPPPELDAANLTQVLDTLAVTHEPPLFIRVTATEGGQPLSAEQLNDLLGPMLIQFVVPHQYFIDHGLATDSVRLIEYSEGRLISTDIIAVNVGPAADGFLFEARITQYSTFSIVGAALAGTSSSAAPSGPAPGGGGRVDSFPISPQDDVIPRVDLLFAPTTSSRFVQYNDVGVLRPEAWMIAGQTHADFDVVRYVRIAPTNAETKVEQAVIHIRAYADAEVNRDRAVLGIWRDGNWSALQRVQLLDEGRWTGQTLVKCCAVFAFGYDMDPPLISTFAPPGNVSGVVVAGALASDNLGLDRVEFYVDGVLERVRTSGPFSLAINTNLLETGPHVVRAVAFDVAGNEAEASSTFWSQNRGSINLTAAADDTQTTPDWWLLMWPLLIAASVLFALFLAIRRTRRGGPGEGPPERPPS